MANSKIKDFPNATTIDVADGIMKSTGAVSTHILRDALYQQIRTDVTTETKSADFSVESGINRNAIYYVTTGATSKTATFPAATVADLGSIKVLIKADAGAGAVLTSGVATGTLTLTGQYSYSAVQCVKTGAASYAWLQIADYVTVNRVGAVLNGATAGTPADADLFGFSVSSVQKKITWANLKAAIKTYYDAVTATLTNKTLASPVLNGEVTGTAVSETGAASKLVKVNASGNTALPGTLTTAGKIAASAGGVDATGESFIRGSSTSNLRIVSSGVDSVARIFLKNDVQQFNFRVDGSEDDALILRNDFNGKEHIFYTDGTVTLNNKVTVSAGGIESTDGSCLIKHTDTAALDVQTDAGVSKFKVDTTNEETTVVGDMIAGYISTGSVKVKVIKLTGTTPSSAGGTSTITHGVTWTKILHASIIFGDTGGTTDTTGNLTAAVNNIDVKTTSTSVFLIANASLASSNFSQACRILLIVEE